MEKRNKVYLSGCMTMDKDHFREHFAEAEKTLTEMGYEVTNTSKVEWDEGIANECGDAWGDKAWREYIKRDIDLVAQHDVVALLSNWEFSMGAYAELASAQRHGLKIIFEKDGFKKIISDWKIKDLKNIELSL